jgi:hypothetical protein
MQCKSKGRAQRHKHFLSLNTAFDHCISVPDSTAANKRLYEWRPSRCSAARRSEQAKASKGKQTSAMADE